VPLRAAAAAGGQRAHGGRRNGSAWKPGTAISPRHRNAPSARDAEPAVVRVGPRPVGPADSGRRQSQVRHSRPRSRPAQTRATKSRPPQSAGTDRSREPCGPVSSQSVQDPSRIEKLQPGRTVRNRGGRPGTEKGVAVHVKEAEWPPTSCNV
jgi:hypothetical protein